MSSISNDQVPLQTPPSRSLLGKPPNHWLYGSKPPTFDLTRPAAPFPEPQPGTYIRLTTDGPDIMISPEHTAIIIVDMQNFFLSEALGRAPDNAGKKAEKVLLEHAIPAVRKAGIQVIWLNWGLMDADMEEMPPTTIRAFGFPEPKDGAGADEAGVKENGKPARLYTGLGSEIGEITTESGEVIDAGRLLFRDSWNSRLTPALHDAFEAGERQRHKPDVWIHKNRMSGSWHDGTPVVKFLREQGIRTLLFAGVNTDQCVLGSLQDCSVKGWDAILLKDCCGTSSPQFVEEAAHWGIDKASGFVSDSQSLEKGVEAMLAAREEVNAQK